MLIVQISDVHLLGSGLLHGRVDTTANLDEVLERVRVAGIRPELILLSGDLADDGSVAAYEALRDRVEPLADALGASVVYVPGNHDDRRAFRDVLLGGAVVGGGTGDPPGDPVTGGGAPVEQEPIDQVCRIGDVRVVVLDSAVPGYDHGELSDAQLGWLAEELADPAPGGTVLAVHHPPIPSPIELMTRIALRMPGRLGEVIAGTDVRAVLSGHYHHATSGMLGCVPVWVCPSTAYLADVLVEPGSFRALPGVAFSRIELGSGGLSATVVPVGTEALVLKTVSSADLGLD